MKIVARWLVLLFAISWPVSVSADALTEYMEARKVFAAAGACMAAYNSRPGSLAVAAFEREGWQIEPFKQVGDKVDEKY